MPCGCQKGAAAARSSSTRTAASPSPAKAATAGSQQFYEVWRDGRYTGRRFTTLLSAQAYARRAGGEIKAR